MHVHVFQIALLWSDVLIGREASDPFLEYKHAKWIHSVDEAINSQVELEVVDQEGFRHVALGYQLLARLDVDVLVVAHKVDAFALAQVDWFNNKRFCLLHAELLLQVVRVTWKDPGFREEIEFVWQDLLHASEVPGQVVLASKCLYSRHDVESLVRLEFHKFVMLNASVSPV